jgi:hypothetical protein
MITFLVAAALIVSVFLAWASSKPDEFKIERSIAVAAPPEKVLPLLNDLRAWQTWSPWAHKDPNVKSEFSGAATGVGAAFAWDGNKKVGKGRMEIVEATAKRVAYKLDFEKPFEGHNRAEISLEPAGSGTMVRWVMTGPDPLVAKVMCSFFDRDKMVGRDFEQGLASIKEIAERA